MAPAEAVQVAEDRDVITAIRSRRRNSSGTWERSLDIALRRHEVVCHSCVISIPPPSYKTCGAPSPRGCVDPCV